MKGIPRPGGGAGASGESERHILRQFRAFNRYLVPYWSLEALVLVIAFVASLLGLVGPYLTRVTIDFAFARSDLLLFHVLLGLGLVLYLVQGVLQILRQSMSAYIRNLLTFDMRREYMRHLFRLPFADLHRRSTGEQIYRMGQDIDTAATLATESIPQILSTVFRLVFLLLVCLYLNWQLVLVALLVAPLFYLHTRYFGRRQSRVTRELKEQAQDATAAIQDALANVKLVKLLDKGRWTVRRYMRYRIRLIRLRLRLVRLNIMGTLTAGALNTIATTGFAYYIGWNVIHGRMTLGTLVALMLYLTQLIAALVSLSGLYRGVMVKVVSWLRLQETLQLQPEREGPDTVRRPRLKGRVTAEHLSFGYEPRRPVLHDVSFDIQPGQFAGLVGPSGSGKTTLLLLVLRLMEPWSGCLRLDGVDLRRLARRDLVAGVGAAPQEALVFNLTIAQNLRLVHPDAAEADLWRALGMADLAETVRGLEHGLDTAVGEGGSNLSEGQRQRLSLARAVLRRPRLLVLDEATSAVGYDSEARIVSAIRRELPHTTVVLSSHRLSSLCCADTILVLDNGRLVESGTHASLVQRAGVYRRLVDGRPGANASGPEEGAGA